MKKIICNPSLTIQEKGNIQELSINEMFEIRGGGSDQLPKEKEWE